MRKINHVDPLHGPVLKNMMCFALPIMAVGLLSMLFSAADTAVIGRFGHEGAISAIGACSSLIMLIGGGVTALAGGVTIVLGQLYGREEKEQIHEIFRSLPLTALALGALTALLMIIPAKPLLRLIHCPEDLLADSAVYFRLYFGGMPFMVLNGFLAAGLEAKGDSVTPLIFSLGAALLNVLMNLLFVIAFDWNLFGVGIATLLSQGIESAAYLMYFTRRSDELGLGFSELILFQRTGKVFSLGVPSSLEGMILNLSGVIIAAAINRFDANVIAGNTIGNTLEGLVAVSFSALASASTVFISQNYGAGDLPRVKTVWQTSVATVFLIAESLGIVLYLLARKLCLIFTTDPSIIEAARTRMFYMCLFYGLCGTMNVVSGCIRGLGNTKGPLIISILSSVVFRVTWIYTYAAAKGTIESIYMAYPLCWALNTVLSIALFEWLFKKKEKQASFIQD